MQGVKTATGDPIMHLGLFIGILFIPKDEVCNEMTYTMAMQVLTASHLINAIRFVIISLTVQMVPLFPSLGFILYFLEKIFDFVGVII